MLELKEVTATAKMGSGVQLDIGAYVAVYQPKEKACAGCEGNTHTDSCLDFPTGCTGTTRGALDTFIWIKYEPLEKKVMDITVPNLVFAKHLEIAITQENDVLFMFSFKHREDPITIQITHDEAKKTNALLSEFLQMIEDE